MKFRKKMLREDTEIMPKRKQVFIRAAAWMTLGAVLAVLPACDTVRQNLGFRKNPQTVDGPRRVPMMNMKIQEQMGRGGPGPMVQRVTPPAGAQPETGGMFASDAPPPETGVASAEEESFSVNKAWNRWFGGGASAAANASSRQPIPGNPLMETRPVLENIPINAQPLPLPVASEMPRPQMEPEIRVAQAGQDYPALTEVPPTPGSFKTIQEEKASRESELTGARSDAEEARRRLREEIEKEKEAETHAPSSQRLDPYERDSHRAAMASPGLGGEEASPQRIFPLSGEELKAASAPAPSGGNKDFWSFLPWRETEKNAETQMLAKPLEEEHPVQEPELAAVPPALDRQEPALEPELRYAPVVESETSAPSAVVGYAASAMAEPEPAPVVLHAPPEERATTRFLPESRYASRRGASRRVADATAQ